MSQQTADLATAIRAARATHGWTQAELARMVGVDQSAISLWEWGGARPDFAHLVDLLLLVPALVAALAPEELKRLRDVARLERELFHGRCACGDCNCAA